MPIRPEMRALYPSDWKELSAWVRFERAGGRCECSGECGEDHDGRCKAEHGEPHPISGSVVVLTTMHLDHDPRNNDREPLADSNLMAGCQRCHNRYDQPYRLKNAARTRRDKSPQIDLVDAIEGAR